MSVIGGVDKQWKNSGRISLDEMLKIHILEILSDGWVFLNFPRDVQLYYLLFILFLSEEVRELRGR